MKAQIATATATAAAVLALALQPAARADIAHLTEGHTDVGIAFEDGEFDLHIHDEEHDIEYAPDEAIFDVTDFARTTVSGNPGLSFLGHPGDTVWILPQTQNPDLLFLGFGAEEIENGTFADDRFTMTLTGITTPAGGKFYLYKNGSPSPTVHMDSSDGLSSADRYTLSTGGHEHFNWAFTASGTYQLTFTANANLPDNTPVTATATYTFGVAPAPVPEPSTYGIIFGGALFALILVRERKRRVA